MILGLDQVCLSLQQDLIYHQKILPCQDFEKESKEYCGTRITDSPLRCGDV